MAKDKTRIPLGNTPVASFNNPFAGLQGVKATNTVVPQQEPAPERVKAAPTAPTKIGKVVVHAERKGRGGKTVTIVERLALEGAELESLCKQMRQALGCGATVEDNTIVLQGDQCERVRSYLKGLNR